jgi:hypothetical protein
MFFSAHRSLMSSNNLTVSRWSSSDHATEKSYRNGTTAEHFINHGVTHRTLDRHAAKPIITNDRFLKKVPFLPPHFLPQTVSLTQLTRADTCHDQMDMKRRVRLPMKCTCCKSVSVDTNEPRVRVSVLKAVYTTIDHGATLAKRGQTQAFQHCNTHRSNRSKSSMKTRRAHSDRHRHQDRHRNDLPLPMVSSKASQSVTKLPTMISSDDHRHLSNHRSALSVAPLSLKTTDNTRSSRYAQSKIFNNTGHSSSINQTKLSSNKTRRSSSPLMRVAGLHAEQLQEKHEAPSATLPVNQRANTRIHIEY